ncbi:hypothetical protein V4Y02_23630, partial [Escherichia coli]
DCPLATLVKFSEVSFSEYPKQNHFVTTMIPLQQNWPVIPSFSAYYNQNHFVITMIALEQTWSGFPA